MLPNDGIAPPSRAPVHLRITGRRSWFDFGARDLWQFRDLIRILAMRDIKLRYRQTALGVAGVVIQPILAAGVLTFVFGRVANLPSEGVPYFAFSYAGFLGWNVFASVIGRASGVLVANSNLVSKIYFPRLLLPLSGVVVALVDLAIAVVVMAALMVAYGLVPGLAIVLAPLWVAGIIAVAMGIGVAAGAVMVHYRDVGTATTTLIQTLLYLTPVAYSASAVPKQFRNLYVLNPVATLIEGLRWSAIGTDAPSVGRAVFCAAFCILIFVSGCVVFTRLERSFADVI